MALAAVTAYDTILSTAVQNRDPKLQDQITESTPTLALLKRSKKGLRIIDGGTHIEYRVMMDTGLGHASSINPYDDMAVSRQDNVRPVRFDWKYAGQSISLFSADLNKCSGKEAIANYLDEQIDIAQEQLTSKMSDMIFSDGTGNNDQDVQGLLHHISTTNTTGTVGGWNRATYSWWRNQANTSPGSFSTNGIEAMDRMYNDCTRLRSSPDIVITHQYVTEWYIQRARQLQRLVGSQKLVDLGIEAFQYKGATLIWDRDIDAEGKMYFLNSDKINLTIHRKDNFAMRPFQTPDKQFGKVALIFFQGNMTSKSQRHLGVISGFSA